jgi:AcrR family transcriptional regulator
MLRSPRNLGQRLRELFAESRRHVRKTRSSAGRSPQAPARDLPCRRPPHRAIWRQATHHAPGRPGRHLSLGGLYHYFPTKRDLVLHALKPEAVARLCAEFHGRHADLARTDPGRYVQADVDYMARQCFFIRPAFHAALELDAEVAWDHIQASIEGGLESCTRPLAYALPECTPEEIHRLGRSVRRTFFSALIDRTVTPDELRQELLSLIQGWPATVHQAATASRVDSWGAASVELEAHR